MQLAKYLIISVLLCLPLLLNATQAKAETMQSSSFRIRLGNFNMTSGGKSSASYSLTDTVGQTAASFFSSSGYAVLAGFQYIYTLNEFSFSISDLAIDLGILTPNTFKSGSHTLTVTAPGQGYSVVAYEINRLTSGSNYLPDTTCDAGTCTETTAGLWVNTSVYGFGYNLSGDDIPATFASSFHFRPFPDLSLGDTPAEVMQSSNSSVNRVSTVTYQANASPTQAAGNYHTQIVYLATPTF